MLYNLYLPRGGVLLCVGKASSSLPYFLVLYRKRRKLPSWVVTFGPPPARSCPNLPKVWILYVCRLSLVGNEGGEIKKAEIADRRGVVGGRNGPILLVCSRCIPWIFYTRPPATWPQAGPIGVEERLVLVKRRELLSDYPVQELIRLI